MPDPTIMRIITIIEHIGYDRRFTSEPQLLTQTIIKGPLWFEEITSEGMYQKVDNIKSAFDRLTHKTKIKKPLKSFKKTSASLLRGSGTFSSLESLFLGHAPQSMSDKHYAQAPQRLLDQAVDWLRTEFGCD